MFICYRLINRTTRNVRCVLPRLLLLLIVLTNNFISFCSRTFYFIPVAFVQQFTICRLLCHRIKLCLYLFSQFFINLKGFNFTFQIFILSTSHDRIVSIIGLYNFVSHILNDVGLVCPCSISSSCSTYFTSLRYINVSFN